jgi:hypothetical protein
MRRVVKGLYPVAAPFKRKTVTTLPRSSLLRPPCPEQDCAMPVWSLVLRATIAPCALQAKHRRYEALTFDSS